MLVISSICMSTFAALQMNEKLVIPPIKVPIHKLSNRFCIIGTLENGIYTLVFRNAFSNVEIKIYKNDILVEDYNGSFSAGQVYTTYLQSLGSGEYTIEVYNNENKIFSSSEEI